MSFEALLAQFQQVAQGHGEQMAALVEQASQLARTVADPDAAAYEVEQAHRPAEKRVAEADAAQAHAERNAREARRAREHAIEERAQADEAAQEALTEPERIRADAETQVGAARDLAEAAATADATAREEAENIRLDAERRVDAAEADAADRIQTALDEQARALGEERHRAEEQAEQLRRETAATVATAHADAAAARTAQTRAETGQQTAEHASAEAQETVEQLRTELAELRQQHRTELDTPTTGPNATNYVTSTESNSPTSGGSLTPPNNAPRNTAREPTGRKPPSPSNRTARWGTPPRRPSSSATPRRCVNSSNWAFLDLHTEGRPSRRRCREGRV